MRHEDMAEGLNQPIWHLLQVSDALDLELAMALAESVPVIAWEPQRTLLPQRIPVGREAERVHPDSSLRLRKLPLLRGFARAPISFFAQTGKIVAARLAHQSSHPELSPLICTTPFFASVAERWPGPIVYWLTDLIAEYASTTRSQVERLDRRMCKVASLVCPNSVRLETYLVDHAGCNPTKIQVVPNATRAGNLLSRPPSGAACRPASFGDIRRPIAGVIGNLAGNMDWVLLERTLVLTPWLSWVFVGPTTMHITDPTHRRAREAVMHHPNTHFVGHQPYGELAHYARAFDVAVLPYKRCEPTYSGSSTRFYEHLAACRPILATRGFEELLRKPPLLQLVDTADQLAAALCSLRKQNFDDGLFETRWRASHDGTWKVRARTIRTALELGPAGTKRALSELCQVT